MISRVDYDYGVVRRICVDGNATAESRRLRESRMQGSQPIHSATMHARHFKINRSTTALLARQATGFIFSKEYKSHFWVWNSTVYTTYECCLPWNAWVLLWRKWQGDGVRELTAPSNYGGIATTATGLDEKMEAHLCSGQGKDSEWIERAGGPGSLSVPHMARPAAHRTRLDGSIKAWWALPLAGPRMG